MTETEMIKAAQEDIRIVISNLKDLDVYSSLNLLAACQFAHSVDYWLSELTVERELRAERALAPDDGATPEAGA